ncbi:MAG: M48 family peptidase, partial [bacterium]
MTRKYLSVIIIVLFIVSCSRNTITGRSQLTLVPESQVQSLAVTQYKEFLNKNKVIPNNSKDAEMVKRVGNKIALAIDKYYNE